MNYEIKHRWTNACLWSGEAESLKAAVEAAVASGSDLSGSDLSGSDLSGSDLRSSNLLGSDLRGSDLSGSNLRYSNLRGSNLSGSNLRGSDLRSSDLSGSDLLGSDLRGSDLSGSDLSGSDLRYSNLRGSNLRGSNLRGSNLSHIKSDVWEILLHAIPEAPALAAALREGRVDGSVYSFECACLVGTLANARGVGDCDIPGIGPESSRPAEVFFSAIKKGDTPETNQVSNIALAWVEEFIALVGAK